MAEGPIGYVKHAGLGDVLLFPGVASCLAVTFVLKDGTLVGGHVPVCWTDGIPQAPLENARKIAIGMALLTGLSSLTVPTTNSNVPVQEALSAALSAAQSTPYVSKIDALITLGDGNWIGQPDWIVPDVYRKPFQITRHLHINKNSKPKVYLYVSPTSIRVTESELPVMQPINDVPPDLFAKNLNEVVSINQVNL
jgi:hypothetical protein